MAARDGPDHAPDGPARPGHRHALGETPVRRGHKTGRTATSDTRGCSDERTAHEGPRPGSGPTRRGGAGPRRVVRPGARLRVAGALLVLALVAGCSGDRSPGRAEQNADQEPTAKAAPAAFRLAPHCPGTPAERRTVSAAELNKLGESLDLRYWQAADIGAVRNCRDARAVR